jgi:NADPH-dependent curcumin reductase CurA
MSYSPMRKTDDEWDEDDVWPEEEQAAAPSPAEPAAVPATAGGTGHPAVDAVLQSLANAARLAPQDQIAEYEAAHRVLQETLATIDR